MRNAYGICLQQGDTPGKLGLIPHGIVISHEITIKASAVEDYRASD